MNAETSALSRTTTVGVFADTNLRWYFTGQFVSVIGSLLQSAVLSLLIIDLAGTVDAAYWVGVIGGLMLGPATLLAPLAGLFLDRCDTKRILFVTTVLGFIQAVALAYLTYAHLASIFAINILVLCTGLITVIDAPGRNVFVKELVGRHQVRYASMVFLSLGNIAQMVGPGAAGFLVWYCGYPITFMVNSVSFVVFLSALVMIRLAPHRSLPARTAPQPGVRESLVRGAVYILRHREIATCIVLTGVVSTFGFSYTSLLSVIVRDMLGGNPVVFSHLALSSGAGAILTLVMVTCCHKFLSHKVLFVSGVVTLGIASVLLSLTKDVTSAAILLFFAGYGFTVSLITIRSSITHLVRYDLVGIVTGYSYTFSCGGMVLGSWGAGIVANRLGCPAELAICGCVLVVVGVASYFLPGIDHLDKKAT